MNDKKNPWADFDNQIKKEREKENDLIKKKYSKEKLVKIARNFALKQDFQKALDYFKLVTEKDPKHFLAWVNMGIIYTYHNLLGTIKGRCTAYFKRHYDEGIECFKKALELKSNDIPSLIGLGDAFRGKKEFTKSIEYFEKIIKIDPKNSENWRGIGFAYLEMMEFENAIDYFEKALKIENNNVDCWIGLGFSYFEKKNLDKSLNCFVNALNYHKQQEKLKKDIIGREVYSNKLEIITKVINHIESEKVNPTFINEIEKEFNIKFENKPSILTFFEDLHSKTDDQDLIINKDENLTMPNSEEMKIDKNNTITRSLMNGALNLTEKELAEELKLISRSLQCPECGAPTGDVSEKSEFECSYCQTTIAVKRLKESTSESLSYQKLKKMADLQVSNATMSSRMDVQYDPKRFIDRKDASEAFERFLTERSPRQKLFLLLGEAGFGKTWLVAHWANQLKQEGYPVFYVRLRDKLGNFFRLTFDSTLHEALHKITPLDDIEGEKPILWIMDGYDEILDRDERRELLIEFLRSLEKRKNQIMVLTSRKYDWQKCRVRQDQEGTLDNMCWRGQNNESASFTLVFYNLAERDAAIKRYGLPGLKQWDIDLKPLAKFPLWVRLIAERYAQEGKLPPLSDWSLFDEYFTRMRLTVFHLKLLAGLCARLTLLGDLSREVDLETISTTVEERTLDVLNSSGILLYEETLYSRTVRLSTRAFGWFGTAYHAFLLDKANRREEFLTFRTSLERLSQKDRPYIDSFIKSLNVPLEDYELMKKTKDLLDQAQAQFNNRQWDAAIDLFTQIRAIWSQLGLSDDIKVTDEMILKAKERANREVQERAKRIVPFRGAQIPQLEADVLQALEKQSGKQFKLVNTVAYNTQMGFSMGNNRVTGIGLYECGLSTLPESIGNLSSLTYLSVSTNNLSTLPESIGNLKSLQNLRLQFNKLTTLPESIGNLSSLETLWLECNNLSTLPESIGNLKSLQNLRLQFNKLTTLPESIGNLSSLETLWLECNNLSTLPESIGNLKSLTYLSVSTNKIATLPESIGNLKSLETLYLRANNLSTLPESIGNLSSLKSLYLHNNQLTTLPKSIGNLKSLERLDLWKNQLTTLPESIENFSSLKELYLHFNQLSTLPESITRVTSLQELSLGDNKLTTLPESISNLRSLEKLYLGDNKFMTLPESIGNLKSLQTLYLGDNKFTTLPESIGNLKSLENLILEGNQLSTLPESIGKLTSLERLYLYENKLSTLPESIGNLKSLSYFDLDKNKLLTLPESITKLTSLEYLDLEGNNSLDSGAKSVLKQLKKKGVLVST